MYNKYIELLYELRTTETKLKEIERDLLQLYLSHNNTLKQEDLKIFLDEILKLEEKEEELRKNFFKTKESVHECQEKLS